MASFWGKIKKAVNKVAKVADKAYSLVSRPAASAISGITGGLVSSDTVLKAIEFESPYKLIADLTESTPYKPSASKHGAVVSPEQIKKETYKTLDYVNSSKISKAGTLLTVDANKKAYYDEVMWYGLDISAFKNKKYSF